MSAVVEGLELSPIDRAGVGEVFGLEEGRPVDTPGDRTKGD